MIYHNDKKKWQVRVTIDGKRKYLKTSAAGTTYYKTDAAASEAWAQWQWEQEQEEARGGGVRAERFRKAIA